MLVLCDIRQLDSLFLNQCHHYCVTTSRESSFVFRVFFFFGSGSDNRFLYFCIFFFWLTRLFVLGCVHFFSPFLSSNTHGTLVIYTCIYPLLFFFSLFSTPQFRQTIAAPLVSLFSFLFFFFCYSEQYSYRSLFSSFISCCCGTSEEKKN